MGRNMLQINVIYGHNQSIIKFCANGLLFNSSVFIKLLFGTKMHHNGLYYFLKKLFGILVVFLCVLNVCLFLVWQPSVIKKTAYYRDKWKYIYIIKWHIAKTILNIFPVFVINTSMILWRILFPNKIQLHYPIFISIVFDELCLFPCLRHHTLFYV